MCGYNQPLGRILRFPLKAVPRRMVIPILSGPNRGLRWIAGSSIHGCWIGWYGKTCVEYVASVSALGHADF